MSSSVLRDRLAELVEAGIVTADDDGLYGLTGAGSELLRALRRCPAGPRTGYGPGVMATIRHHPAAAGLALLAVGCVVVFGGFLLLLRSSARTPPPGSSSAQGMAHRLLSGRRASTPTFSASGEYVFRVVYQTSDGNVGATLAATHIGVAVCLRGDAATEAARFSYLHFNPACHDGRLLLTPAEATVAQDRAT